jgi:V/A-type H+-transporting ATPase subunit I
MAVVKMKKLILAAHKDEKDEILDAIQDEGCVEIFNIEDSSLDEDDAKYVFKEADTTASTEMEFNNIKFTYDFLGKFTGKKKDIFKKRDILTKKEFEGLDTKIDWNDLYNQCKDIEFRLNEIKSIKAKTISSIEQYDEWLNLDVSSKNLNELKSVSYFIGAVSMKYENQLYEDLSNEVDDAYIEIISKKHQNINFLLIYHNDDIDNVSDILKRYGFSKSTLDFDIKPKDRIQSLKENIDKLDGEYEALMQKGKELSLRIDDVEKAYDYVNSKLEKERAKSNLLRTEKTFILEGWVPEDKGERMEGILVKRFRDIFIEIEEPSDEDMPPVKLKNNALVEPFEIITGLYSLPLPTELDPTPLLMPFFMVFFGMMMADAGYGLMMIAISVVMLKFMDLKENAKKMAKLILYCSFPTIVFGLLYGSFFGGIIPMKPLWVAPLDNTMEVLGVSIIMGLIHIYFGLGIKAYSLIKSGKVLDAVYDVFFWYALLSGLIWLLLGGGKPAEIISIIGALGLLATQGRESKSIAGKFFGGLYGLYGVTSYLGDALSYSRLLALGLSSGLIGWSFNLIIGMLGKSVGAIIFGAIIFVVGHTFNFLIGGLGAFVHTCRLQYLEFFGKFFEGGGVGFKPLTYSTEFIKLDMQK